MKSPFFYYKFVSFERKDVLEHNKIRFTPIGEFNDPFELEPTITPLSKKYISFLMSASEKELSEINMTSDDYHYSQERQSKIKEYKDKFRNEIGKYGVLSLTTNENVNQLLTVSMPDKKDPRANILMWSHYADSHKGFVIEFSKDFIDDLNVKKVKYSNERDFITFEDIDDNNFDHIFYKKSGEWAYEQEYRAIVPLDNAKEVNDKKCHLFSFNKWAVKSITFGCAMSKENKKIIMDLIKSDTDYQGVKFNHARLSDDDFCLEFYFDDGKWSNNPDSIFAPFSIPNQKKL